MTNMDELIDFLFRFSNWNPQIGFARMDKRALLWVPGKKKLNYEYTSKIISSAPMKGCTQLAFKNATQPITPETPCEIVWVGLDIDKDDNPNIDLPRWFAENWFWNGQYSMIRTSSSGQGIHLIFVLAEPVRTVYGKANRLVKAITRPIVSQIEERGLHVCKADRRMFWLIGGKNDIIAKDNYVLTPDIDLEVDLTNAGIPAPIKQSTLEVSDKVRTWVELFQKHKILPPYLVKSNPIYIGDVVAVLREAGEAVKTASSCSGNGNVNGYIDISPNQISVWSYADGHTIWSYQDIRGLFNGT